MPEGVIRIVFEGQHEQPAPVPITPQSEPAGAPVQQEQSEGAAPIAPAAPNISHALGTAGTLFVGVLTEGASLITRRFLDTAAAVTQSGRDFAASIRSAFPGERQREQPAPVTDVSRRTEAPRIPDVTGTHESPAWQHTVAAASDANDRTKEAAATIVGAGREFAAAVKEAEPQPGQPERQPGAPGQAPQERRPGLPDWFQPQGPPSQHDEGGPGGKGNILEQAMSGLKDYFGRTRVGRMTGRFLGRGGAAPGGEPEGTPYTEGMEPPPIRYPAGAREGSMAGLSGGIKALGAVAIAATVLEAGFKAMNLATKETTAGIKTAGEAQRQKMEGDLVSARLTERELTTRRIRDYVPLVGGTIANFREMQDEKTKQFQGMRGTLQKKADELADYSPELAAAKARAEAFGEMQKIQQARALAPSLSKFVEQDAMFKAKQGWMGALYVPGEAKRVGDLEQQGINAKNPVDFQKALKETEKYNPDENDLVAKAAGVMGPGSQHQGVAQEIINGFNKVVETMKGSGPQQPLGMTAIEKIWEGIDPNKIAGRLLGQADLEPHVPGGLQHGPLPHPFMPIFDDILNRR